MKPDLSGARNLLTIETLILTVFDIYWQSEMNMKDALAVLIGDKYIQCLNHLDTTVTASGEHNSIS